MRIGTRNGRRYREYPTLPGAQHHLPWLAQSPELPTGTGGNGCLSARSSRASTFPVLTVTGYYSSGDVGLALLALLQHHQHKTRANHALLIEPYDDQSVERGPASALRGFPARRVPPS